MEKKQIIELLKGAAFAARFAGTLLADAAMVRVRREAVRVLLALLYRLSPAVHAHTAWSVR